MSLTSAREVFLSTALEGLTQDDRVLAVMMSGSTGRGEAEEWSDLDLIAISAPDSESVLACPSEAERYGDLLIWVDCSFNAPPGGTMALARYASPEGMVLVDWTVWPVEVAKRTAGSGFFGHAPVSLSSHSRERQSS